MTDDDDKPYLSVVCPVFNEEEAVPLFYERLMSALAGLREDQTIEVTFVDNRSTDRTRQVVAQLRERDPRVQLLTLSRNFGYQYSVYAGLRQSRGTAIVTIDVDCEDPPELIPEFLEHFEQGIDIVYGERDRRQEPAWVTMARKLFYRINKAVADSDIILDMAEFSLMRHSVRDAVVSSRTTFPFVRAEIAHYGFTRRGIRYDRQARIAGKSSYNLLGMTIFAVAGILSSTTVPLRLPAYALPVVVVVNLALLAADLAGVDGAFHALATVDLLFLGATASAIALYLSRTYRNVVSRPLVVVDWHRSKVNTPPESSPNWIPALWGKGRG